MRTLLEIRNELDTAKNFVVCGFKACESIDDTDGVLAVLAEARTKLERIAEALSYIKEQQS